MSQADEIASGGQASEGVDRAAQLMRRVDATQPTATFKKVMALTSAGVFVDAMDVYLAGGVKSTLAETGFATNEQTAAFLSAGFLGLFIGSLIAGLIGDKLGRRKAFQFNLLLFGFATILGALSPNMTFMIAMRFFVGLGLGSELVTSFSMINEFAPVARRGHWCAIGSTALITVLGFLMTIGFYVLNASVISVYVGELFSTRYRFRGVGISQGAGKAVNVVMPFAVTWILANLQPNVIYLGIVAIALVAAAVTLAIGPETKSRRLG